jgi:hypothetical protein
MGLTQRIAGSTNPALRTLLSIIGIIHISISLHAFETKLDKKQVKYPVLSIFFLFLSIL